MPAGCGGLGDLSGSCCGLAAPCPRCQHPHIHPCSGFGCSDPCLCPLGCAAPLSRSCWSHHVCLSHGEAAGSCRLGTEELCERRCWHRDAAEPGLPALGTPQWSREPAGRARACASAATPLGVTGAGWWQGEGVHRAVPEQTRHWESAVGGWLGTPGPGRALGCCCLPGCSVGV